MQFYNSHYGDKKDLSTPQFKVVGKNIFPTLQNKEARGAVARPWFEIQNGKVYNTAFHPEGKTVHAQYEIKNNAVHTTEHHALGRSSMPIFHIRTK